MVDEKVFRNRQKVESLKKDLKILQSREHILKEELAQLEAQKKELLKAIDAHSDEKYQEELLQKVYAQRVAERKKG